MKVEESNYKITDLFPLAFYEGKLSCHEEFKTTYYDSLKEYNLRAYREHIPYILFHQEKGFDILFNSMKENFQQYMSVLGVDSTKLSFQIVKCWLDWKKPDNEGIFDINDSRYDLPHADPGHSHWHNGSDLTFVYYFSADNTSDQFYLQNCFGNQNDTDALLQNIGYDFYDILMEWNKYNVKHHVYQPEEGSIIIIPSRVYHYIRRSGPRKSDRITIGGDVKITCNLSTDGAKQKQTITHPSFWREL